MLVASRDPPLYSGAHEVSHISGHHAAHAPHATRFMTALQLIGSVLAIPVGLASGYSIYHANFSPEARCQSLRANIISMLDKSADASTLRMLVRRDVADVRRRLRRGRSRRGGGVPDAARCRTCARRRRAGAGGASAGPAAESRSRETGAGEVHSSCCGQAGPARCRGVRRQLAGGGAPGLDPCAIDTRRSCRGSCCGSGGRASERAASPHPARYARTGFVAGGARAGLAARSLSRHRACAAGRCRASVPPAPIPEAAPLPKPAAVAPAERHSRFSGLIAQIPLLGRVIGH